MWIPAFPSKLNGDDRSKRFFLAFAHKYFLSSSSLPCPGAVVPPALLQGLILWLPAGIQEADLCIKMIAQNEHFNEEITNMT